MEFYLGFLVFYVHLVHIFPPNFSVRRHGIQEVSGSIPLISTQKYRKSTKNRGFTVLFALLIFCCFRKFSPMTTTVTTNI